MLPLNVNIRVRMGRQELVAQADPAARHEQQVSCS
jgi:hypothetical protein